MAPEATDQVDTVAALRYFYCLNRLAGIHEGRRFQPIEADDAKSTRCRELTARNDNLKDEVHELKHKLLSIQHDHHNLEQEHELVKRTLRWLFDGLRQYVQKRTGPDVIEAAKNRLMGLPEEALQFSGHDEVVNVDRDVRTHALRLVADLKDDSRRRGDPPLHAYVAAVGGFIGAFCELRLDEYTELRNQALPLDGALMETVERMRDRQSVSDEEVEGLLNYIEISRVNAVAAQKLSQERTLNRFRDGFDSLERKGAFWICASLLSGSNEPHMPRPLRDLSRLIEKRTFFLDACLKGLSYSPDSFDKGKEKTLQSLEQLKEDIVTKWVKLLDAARRMICGQDAATSSMPRTNLQENREPTLKARPAEVSKGSDGETEYFRKLVAQQKNELDAASGEMKKLQQAKAGLENECLKYRREFEEISKEQDQHRIEIMKKDSAIQTLEQQKQEMEREIETLRSKLVAHKLPVPEPSSEVEWASAVGKAQRVLTQELERLQKENRALKEKVDPEGLTVRERAQKTEMDGLRATIKVREDQAGELMGQVDHLELCLDEILGGFKIDNFMGIDMFRPNTQPDYGARIIAEPERDRTFLEHGYKEDDYIKWKPPPCYVIPDHFLRDWPGMLMNPPFAEKKLEDCVGFIVQRSRHLEENWWLNPAYHVREHHVMRLADQGYAGLALEYEDRIAHDFEDRIGTTMVRPVVYLRTKTLRGVHQEMADRGMREWEDHKKTVDQLIEQGRMLDAQALGPHPWMMHITKEDRVGLRVTQGIIRKMGRGRRRRLHTRARFEVLLKRDEFPSSRLEKTMRDQAARRRQMQAERLGNAVDADAPPYRPPNPGAIFRQPPGLFDDYIGASEESQTASAEVTSREASSEECSEEHSQSTTSRKRQQPPVVTEQGFTQGHTKRTKHTQSYHFLAPDNQSALPMDPDQQLRRRPDNPPRDEGQSQYYGAMMGVDDAEPSPTPTSDQDSIGNVRSIGSAGAQGNERLGSHGGRPTEACVSVPPEPQEIPFSEHFERTARGGYRPINTQTFRPQDPSRYEMKHNISSMNFSFAFVPQHTPPELNKKKEGAVLASCATDLASSEILDSLNDSSAPQSFPNSAEIPPEDEDDNAEDRATRVQRPPAEIPEPHSPVRRNVAPQSPEGDISTPQSPVREDSPPQTPEASARPKPNSRAVGKATGENPEKHVPEDEVARGSRTRRGANQTTTQTASEQEAEGTERSAEAENEKVIRPKRGAAKRVVNDEDSGTASQPKLKESARPRRGAPRGFASRLVLDTDDFQQSNADSANVPPTSQAEKPARAKRAPPAKKASAAKVGAPAQAESTANADAQRATEAETVGPALRPKRGGRKESASSVQDGGDASEEASESVSAGTQKVEDSVKAPRRGGRKAANTEKANETPRNLEEDKPTAEQSQPVVGMTTRSRNRSGSQPTATGSTPAAEKGSAKAASKGRGRGRGKSTQDETPKSQEPQVAKAKARGRGRGAKLGTPDDEGSNSEATAAGVTTKQTPGGRKRSQSNKEAAPEPRVLRSGKAVEERSRSQEAESKAVAKAGRGRKRAGSADDQLTPDEIAAMAPPKAKARGASGGAKKK